MPAAGRAGCPHGSFISTSQPLDVTEDGAQFFVRIAAGDGGVGPGVAVGELYFIREKFAEHGEARCQIVDAVGYNNCWKRLLATGPRGLKTLRRYGSQRGDAAGLCCAYVGADLGAPAVQEV